MQDSDKKKDIIWNALGSLMYALSSMILAFWVARELGMDEGGIFGFGFSTLGQQAFIIAYFGVRPFQITDTEGNYTLGTYIRLRSFTSAAAIFFAAAYILILLLSGSYDIYKAAALFMLAAYKIIDGYADVYESEFQRAGSLYAGGRALFLRTLISMAAFMLVIAISGSLILASVIGVLIQLLGCNLFDINPFYRIVPGEKRSMEIREGRLASLFTATLPLFLSSFLDFYIFSSSKYAIDWFGTNSDSGIFNILFMPTSFIYLVANFIMRPFMTELAALYELSDRNGFMSMVRRLFLAVAGLMLAVLLGVIILGGPVLYILEMILGQEGSGILTGRLGVFFLIILGGGIYAINNLFYYILVIIGRRREIFFIYLFGALCAFFVSRSMVAAFGLEGAAGAYVILMLLMLAGFLLVLFRKMGRAFR